MILIYPPIAKPSEPPPGIARLSGALSRHRHPHAALDANLEGIHYLLARPLQPSDTWTARALRHLPSHLHLLTRPRGYEDAARYRRAVQDVNRVLGKSAAERALQVSLANYSDERLSPLRSDDLLKAAEEPEKSPFFPYFRERLLKLAGQVHPGAAGLSVNYLSQALSAFSMLGFLRKECPRMRLILGGGLITSWMRAGEWKNPFGGLVDDLVAGRGEEALVSMAGLSYVAGSDLPDYDTFQGHPYFAPGFILPYSTSTGCYWGQCSFCPESSEGNPYRPLPPRNAVEEVKALAGRKRPALVHFLDNALSPAFLEEVARSNLGLPWYGFVRVTRHLADPDFCSALRKSGCLMLKLGLESGDQDVLDQLRKGVDVRLASRALKSLAEAGIGTYVYLLFGTPPESLKSAKRTLEFTVSHSEHIDFLNLAIFNMPLQCPDAERYGTGPFYEGDLSLYTRFHHPSGWDRPLVRAFLDKEFKKHPSIGAILRREPPFFTSNHAPFFLERRREACERG